LIKKTNKINKNQTKIVFNIRKSNANLEAWWPASLKQDEKKLQNLRFIKFATLLKNLGFI
jgi:hypothetical protein